MRALVSVLIGVVGVAFAIWLLLVGGALQIASGASANPTDAAAIAVGAIRVCCTSFGIWLAVALAMVVGAALDR